MRFCFHLLFCSALSPATTSTPTTPAHRSNPTPRSFILEISSVAREGAVIDVDPVYETTRYIAAVEFAEDFDAEAVVAANKAAFIASAADAGKTLAEFIEDYAFKGEKRFPSAKLSPKTAYTAYAYGIDEEGDATTDVFTRPFTTEAVPAGEKADCTFMIRIDNLTDVSADVTFTPSDDTVWYYYEVTDQAGYDAIRADWNGYFYEYLTSHITENLTLEDVVKIFCSHGEQFAPAKKLTPQTTYYAFAVGIGMDALLVTDVVVEPFTTLETQTVDYGFDSSVSNITSRGAEVSITPRSLNPLYYWNVMTEDQYTALGRDEAKIAAWFEETMLAKRAEELGAYADYYPLPDYILNQCSDKPDSYAFSMLSASTNYYVYAFWVDEGTAEIASETYFSETFRTLDKVVSAATATAALWLTDGDDWAAQSPVGYGHFAGKAILGARVEPSSDAVHWYSNIFNAADLDKYSDDLFISTLLKSPFKDKSAYNLSYTVDWGGDYAIVSVAEDADGNMGEVSKVLFRADKSAAEPLTELPE